jgi:hypothetical protein
MSSPQQTRRPSAAQAARRHRPSKLGLLGTGYEAEGEQPLRAGPGTCHTGLMPVNTRCAAVLAGTALLGIGLDQATKVLLVATLEGKPPIRVVG